MSISTFPYGQSPPAGGWLVPVLGGNISCSQGKGGWGWCSGGGEEAHPLLQELRSDCNTEQQLREEKQPTTDTSPESLPSSPCAHPPPGSPCRSCRTPASSSGKTPPCTLHTRAWNGLANTTDGLTSASQELSPAYRKEQKWGKGSFLPTCHMEH